AVVVITLLFLIVRAFAWRILLNGKATAGQTFLAINEGYLLNNILPLRAGEIGRAFFLGRSAGINPFHVLSTIVIERAFDMVIAAALMLATLPLALGMEDSLGVVLVVMVIVLIGLLVLFLMARNQDWVNRQATRYGQRWPLIERFVLPQIKALLEGLSALNNPLLFFGSFGLIALSWLLAVTEYYILLLPFAPDAPFWWGIFTDATLALGIAVPSAPGSLGVFEAAIVGALAVLGVSRSQALAYAITLHVLQYVITGVIGVYGLVREGQSLDSLLAQLKMRRERADHPG
ncbi:MAG TPA: lysylphosphatidylglycerol synthase transmembrane domain-containing protein, partial [Anaerolineaceae bacterium]|nr:lysylphosphatidylglycerol synthase transmembrane domain-containing protein [Anaerolineaceae bacterium]